MIVFHEVSKLFYNDTYGVKDVTFYIEPGEMVIISGPTGSGKTTVARLLTKEYEPTNGKIIFDENDLSQIKPKYLYLHRRKIGTVFQDYKLLPELNVWENLALPLNIVGKNQLQVEKRVSDLLTLIKIENKAELFPSELSGGETQRVSIARALSTTPPVLFADEPTGNLDSITSAVIFKLLKKINEMGTTVLLATHDLVILNQAKDFRQIELKDGTLINDSNQKTYQPSPQLSAKKQQKKTIKLKHADLPTIKKN